MSFHRRLPSPAIHCIPFPVLCLLLPSVLLPKHSLALICYSCTTTLSPVNVEDNAKMALRLFLNSVYELPPVHRFCSLEDDIEFKTVTTIQCSIANDECVKVRAENEGLEFVIRGCKSKIYKPDVSIPQNAKCQSSSPSLCFCKDNLCNSAFRPATKLTHQNWAIVTLSASIGILLLIFHF